MAKNWKPAEAVLALKSGDKSAIQDIGRRFPLFLSAALSDVISLLENLPEYVTVRTIETRMKEGVVALADDTDEAEEAAPVAETAKPVAKAKPAAKPAAKPTAKPADEDTSEDEDLDSMSTKDLYLLCKNKGLKVEPKKDKKVYIAALNKASTPAEVEEDEWADEEEEPAKPAPKAKPAAAKPAAKPAAKAKPAKADEDEDWDI